MTKLASLVLCITIAAGCSLPLTPELITALSKDAASFCLTTDLHGGAGGGAVMPAPVVPLAGYGSATLSFCRSNQPNAVVSLNPDGSMRIEHGVGVH